MITFKRIGDGAFHVQTDNKSTGLLSKYGFLNDSLSKSYVDASMKIIADGIVMHGAKRDVNVKIKEMKRGGYRLDLPLSKNERLFGIGDANRDQLMMRGRSIGIWVSNVISYGPLPILISSDGWAILVNSTFRQKFDIGSTDKDLLTIYVADDKPDFYLFAANSMKELISEITDISGKPQMLPAFGYGLTFVENEKLTGAKQLLDDIRKMREIGIPCDIFGLEPSWMQTCYDFSNDKKWDPDKFYLNYWRPANDSGRGTFFAPMRYMGMQLSLWLCEDYDLIYEEERRASERPSIEMKLDDADAEQESFNKNVEFQDEHLISKIYDVKHTKIDEPWFEHLKKFVDNGAACFKLDGSNQVLEHPQRAWAEKYFDKEIHNLYPVVLAKQMNEGFRDHTGRRSMIYSAGGYIGIQKYAATWAGDTGGGPRTLVSCMNYAMCGHTNTSCDMDLNDPLSIHYGFLQSWSQINSWASHVLPWYLMPETENMIRDYSRLRSSLFPYIYSAANVAAKTGLPMLRPLPLAYEETDRFDGVKNAYMLGDYLYVGAFDMNLSLPDGKWIDYFTGKEYSGDITYEIPSGKGGALFAKAGSIIGTMTPQLYINEREHDYVIRVFPGDNASFTLYEDDGFTYDYMNGGSAKTVFTLIDNGDKGCSVKVNMREGSFTGRPDNGHDIHNNSIPKIEGIKPIRDMKIAIHNENVKSIKLDENDVCFEICDGVCLFTLDAKEHSKRVLEFVVEYK